jgi:aryl-alcohol dehydrogenase-like predicted oxidoreductase
MQFHTWEDSWASDEQWQQEVTKLKRDGKIQAVGISINRWEPNNSLETLKTGLIDAVQVIYNIFDQAPEDELLPLCTKLNLGVLARVPFDEGSLTGAITRDTRFPKEDWRSSYFSLENLMATMERVERLQLLVPPGMGLAEMALRFVLSNRAISATIPGMRKRDRVRMNISISDRTVLPKSLLGELQGHRWDRKLR